MSDIKKALKKAEELKNFAESLENSNLSQEELIAAIDQLEAFAKQTLNELNELLKQK